MLGEGSAVWLRCVLGEIGELEIPGRHLPLFGELREEFLPILLLLTYAAEDALDFRHGERHEHRLVGREQKLGLQQLEERSEERRVGKESRSCKSHIDQYVTKLQVVISNFG